MEETKKLDKQTASETHVHQFLNSDNSPLCVNMNSFQNESLHQSPAHHQKLQTAYLKSKPKDKEDDPSNSRRGVFTRQSEN